MELPVSPNEAVARPKHEPFEKELARIVGPEHVLHDPDELARYFAEPTDPGELVAVRPENTEEVQDVVRTANELGLPVRTLTDRHLHATEAGQAGILLDFSRMTSVEKLDKRNLLAHVQRGLTFEALKKELDKQDVKIAPPLAATSESVLCNFVNRAPHRKATLYAEPHVYNMQVVLADGTLFRTGSHALNDFNDCREDGGPSLSRWYLGADDIFGVVTRATVWLYPKTECRDALLFGFDSLEDAAGALRNGPRTELGWEYLAANRRFLSFLLGTDVSDLAPWTLVVGFDAQKRLVEYQKKKVLEMIPTLGGKPVKAHQQRVLALLDEVWYQASPLHTGFYAACNRIRELDGIARKHLSRAGVASDHVGQCLLSVNRGRCLYATYDVFADPSKHRGSIESLESELAAQGAFFDRPQGNLARQVLGSVPNLREHIRTIKSVTDPKGILNPGRHVSLDDPGYTPPSVAIDTEEDTGISVDNLREVEQKLKEVLGADWVSSNPADLSSYGRDFTIFSGERPNIVVLPETTEEVQRVMRIAYEHKIPLVPLSTGFNHGGLTIPRKGGILVDLKRMKRILEIDEETLTACFEPGVRMRNLWQECQKVQTYRGLNLKPILPLTLGSISLLSNYVSRGGPGSAVKYGFGSDLTVNMTWVLPNGEILRTGPSSVPGVGNLGINWGPGPDISGMFFNADGAFGICTRITGKLYPDMPCEHLIQTGIFDEDPAGIEKACNAIYDLSQETLVEFMYKSHPGVTTVGLGGILGLDPLDLLPMTPKQPLFMIVTGLDEEQIQIRKELVQDVLARNEVMVMDPSMLPPELAELIYTDPLKASLGVKNNTVGAYKGAFQWQAGYISVGKIPAITAEYQKLIRKYWKTSDVKVSMEAALTGTDIQGPLPYARLGTVEFDYWWDQGNPESVKRASVMIRKTSELLFKYGAIPIRNMFGFGELLLPRLGAYHDLVKKMRRAFDPANLMHPDVIPATDDYV
jgi:FAD/FMN-containing dehydrogenase